MVKLEKVNKYFNRGKRNEIHVINNTSLELKDKGLVAILGNSGSGKTTLLNVIGGLDRADKGKIYINGKKITKKGMNKVDKIRNNNIGYIFQDYKLLENMSVFENVAITLRMIGINDKNKIEGRVNYVLKAVNMLRYRNRQAKMLSGGEKQRVAIARAIAKNPNIIIADEPTGNLDSKNSLEIMNIIKTISKEKLVILVTHEVDLAKFYATRIIEIRDGKIEKDYPNHMNESLEYRLDNKIYLKDFKNVNNFKKENLSLELYSDAESNPIDVKIVVKNGNIFIKADNGKVDIVDKNSAIELIDDHYKKIDKSIYEEHRYNVNGFIDEKYKVKYRSIYGLARSIKYGLNRIINYTILKKFLLLGFLTSSMFVTYSVCNIAGILDIRESDYMKIDRNYLQVDMAKVNVDEYLKYEKLDNIEYLIPGDSIAKFKIRMNNYYQLFAYSYELSGSLVDINKINDKNIIKGTMPKNDYEIVIDKKIVSNLLNTEFSSIKAMGIKDEDELLNMVVSIDDMDDFKIVGIVDKTSASIYVNKSIFINILNNMSRTQNLKININDHGYESEPIIKDYSLYLNDITLMKGRMPENDYEVIVNVANKEDIKLNKTIDVKVNGKALTVVGYYESKTNRQDYLVNNNTIKYNLITKCNGFMIYPKDKIFTKGQFKYGYNLNVIDKYEQDKTQYINDKKEEMKNSIIFSGIIFVISLIEIYLMIRSSFLSRIKEVGVLRAIGVKRRDIYNMFLGEIISITTVASMPGIILMTYILSQLTRISYLSRMFVVNSYTVGSSIAIIYLFNIIVGLLPLFRILREEPAKILAKSDIE